MSGYPVQWMLPIDEQVTPSDDSSQLGRPIHCYQQMGHDGCMGQNIRNMTHFFPLDLNVGHRISDGIDM
jgi:hypothetical protein